MRKTKSQADEVAYLKFSSNLEIMVGSYLFFFFCHCFVLFSDLFCILLMYSIFPFLGYFFHSSDSRAVVLNLWVKMLLGIVQPSHRGHIRLLENSYIYISILNSWNLQSQSRKIILWVGTPQQEELCLRVTTLGRLEASLIESVWGVMYHFCIACERLS